MKRASIATAVLLAFLLGGAFAQEKEAPPAPYEYRVFLMNFPDYKDKDDWAEFKERNGGNEMKADAEFKGHVLNHLAKEGWELVQVLSPKPEVAQFYLRRPRR